MTPQPIDQDRQEISQTVLHTLLNTLPDLIFVKDSGGYYVECNEAFACFCGVERAEIIGKTDYALFPKDIADFFRQHDREMIQNGHPKRNEEWVSYPDGRRVLLDTLKMPYYLEKGSKTGVLGISRDITRLKEIEEESAISFQHYSAAIESSIDGFWLVSNEGRILEVNDAYCTYSGYDRSEILQMTINDLDASEAPQTTQERIAAIVEKGSAIFESVHRRKDGSYWPVEVSASFSPLQGGCFFAFLRDISDRKVTEELTKLRYRLSEMIYQDDIHLMLREALDVAERLTFSAIGFFHFVHEDEETIALQTWSSRTLNEMCYAKGEGLHYPVSEAGVWVDCIHQRKPVIHNDYAALPHKKGMPDGHPPLIREITVPLFRNGKIVSVIGLGNKETHYTNEDIEIVERVSNLCFEYAERRRVEHKLQYMAYNDVLTGLPNRQLFSDRLLQSILHSKRTGETLAICYLDLDSFKPINDQFGHDVGDALLIEFAQRLKRELREGDTLARLGGDEFALILNGLKNIASAEEIVTRLLNVAAIAFEIDDHRLHISASIGITCYPQDPSDVDTLLRHADQAMYKAKEKGKNTYHLHAPIHSIQKIEQKQSLERFKAAIERHQLVLHYQPRINLQTGELVGVEALVRWNHPDKGRLLPGAFLPLIEGSPLEIALDEWVIKTAIAQHQTWRDQGLDLQVSINVAPRHIQQSSFPDYLGTVLSHYPPGTSNFIEFEVLETSAIRDTAVVAEIMKQCADLGVHFSLDDFGTGYASLTHFHRLPIDVLKIDQNFVRNMLTSPEDQRIVEGVLQLAETINRPVVAEGIESKELGFMLHQLGCHYAQGYAIAKPMPARELLDWSRRWKQDDFWQYIEEKAKDLTASYDLNVAIFTSQRWLDQVLTGLSGSPDALNPNVEETARQFSQWYHGIGKHKFGDRPQFPFLLAKNNVMRALAQELLRKAETAEASEQDIEALKEANHEFVEMLKKLAKG